MPAVLQSSTMPSSPRDDDDKLQLISNGLDGNGNYFLTTSDHQRLRSESHGRSVRWEYNDYSPVLPAGVISHPLINTGTTSNPNISSVYSGEQVRLAYTAARNDNPLVTGSGAESPYAKHKVIYNFSFVGSHDVLFAISRDLGSLSAFEAKSNLAEMPAGIIGVGALGNSDTTWSSGFRKESIGLLLDSYFHDSLSDSTIAAKIGDYSSESTNSVEIDTDLTDLIANTPTAQLTELVAHNSWETPAGRISSIFPDIGNSLAAKVSEAGQTRLRTRRGLQISLLDLLAGATVHARTGHYYTAGYVNRAGDDTFYKTHCGVVRDGCFMFQSVSLFRTGTSHAAPRLTAVIDTLWLIWPELTNLSMHRLLRTCAVDLGAPGVDPVFGQGLLDLECLVQPSGGLQIPTAQVAGLSGSLIGPSTAESNLATQDDFGRHFNYTAVRTATQTRAFNPLKTHTFTPIAIHRACCRPGQC